MVEGLRLCGCVPGVALHHCRGSCGIGGSITGAREVPLHGVEHTVCEKLGEVWLEIRCDATASIHELDSSSPSQIDIGFLRDLPGDAGGVAGELDDLYCHVQC